MQVILHVILGKKLSSETFTFREAEVYQGYGDFIRCIRQDTMDVGTKELYTEPAQQYLSSSSSRHGLFKNLME